MIMKNCSNCFRTNDDEAEYCQNCGTNFEAEEAHQGDPKFNEPMSASQKCGYWFGAWVIVIVASVAVTATPACVLAAPYFPIGLFVWFPHGESKAIEGWMSGAWAFGWLFYLLLSVIMFSVNRRGVFFIIYTIFCVLLAFNVVGCQRVIGAASGIH